MHIYLLSCTLSQDHSINWNYNTFQFYTFPSLSFCYNIICSCSSGVPSFICLSPMRIPYIFYHMLIQLKVFLILLELPYTLHAHTAHALPTSFAMIDNALMSVKLMQYPIAAKNNYGKCWILLLLLFDSRFNSFACSLVLVD